MILFAAATAAWTSGGASAGAAARPLGRRTALGPAARWLKRLACLARRSLADSYSAPPVAASADGAATRASTTSMKMCAARRNPRTNDSFFRRPAGLADGLAQKEPALHADLR